jgi:hypothetical protein
VDRSSFDKLIPKDIAMGKLVIDTLYTRVANYKSLVLLAKTLQENIQVLNDSGLHSQNNTTNGDIVATKGDGANRATREDDNDELAKIISMCSQCLTYLTASFVQLVG